MATKRPKTYSVTVTSADDTYDVQQLSECIFESLHAVAQDNAVCSPAVVPEEETKGDS